jgi:hypothetical protein
MVLLGLVPFPLCNSAKLGTINEPSEKLEMLLAVNLPFNFLYPFFILVSH